MKKFVGINYLFNDQGMNLAPGTILMRPKQGIFRNNRLLLNRVGSIFQNPPGIGNANAVSLGQPQNAQLYYARNTQVNLGGNVGNALLKTEARISFANANNAIIIYSNGVNNSLNWGNLANSLAKYWKTSGYLRNWRNMFIVTEVIITNRAKVVYSVQNNTSVTVQYAGNGTFNTLGSLINLDVGLVNNARSVQAIGSGADTHLLFNVIRWKPQIQGFEPFMRF
jgi:hypothetical protein